MSGARLAEWVLLGIGVACLITVALRILDERAFQARQQAAFARESTARAADAAASGTGLPESVREHSDAAPPAVGTVIGMLEIPRLHLSTAVVEGDDDATLDKAVGHLPDTPLPWQAGNSAVAAHRDRLFRPLERIATGDDVILKTTDAEIRYRVAATSIVAPDDLSVLEPRARDSLTLITCYPFRYVGHAPKRFIVHADRE